MSWSCSIVTLSHQSLPFTHKAFAECTDDSGNYRGIELGKYFSYGEAHAACVHDKATRTDWRTATECDAA